MEMKLLFHIVSKYWVLYLGFDGIVSLDSGLWSARRNIFLRKQGKAGYTYVRRIRLHLQNPQSLTWVRSQSKSSCKTSHAWGIWSTQFTSYGRLTGLQTQFQSQLGSKLHWAPALPQDPRKLCTFAQKCTRTSSREEWECLDTCKIRRLLWTRCNSIIWSMFLPIDWITQGTESCLGWGIQQLRTRLSTWKLHFSKMHRHSKMTSNGKCHFRNKMIIASEGRRKI